MPTAPAADLTACFVARNHARDLPAALASARAAAAHLLVVDTGSTDGTADVARAQGATVVEVAWGDDFAAACNAALAAVATGWVLWLNPDETVPAASAGRIREATGNPTALAYGLLVQQQLAADRPAYGTAGRQWRLFRKHDALWFRGRVHPTLAPPDAVASALGFDAGPLDAVVLRHAYLNELTPDKIRFTNRLIEAELRDRPGQTARTVELGRNLLLLNDPRGHDVLGDAAAELQPLLDRGAAPPPGTGPLIEYLLTAAGDRVRGPLDRAAARRAAAAWYQADPPVVWAFAGDRFQAQDYATAATLLDRLLELGRTGGYDADLGFDPDIVGRGAAMNLGQCYLHLNRPADARACFEALRTDPRHGPRAAELLAALDAVRPAAGKSST